MLPRLVAQAATTQGDVLALRAPQGWGVSFAELDLLTNECAAWLSHRGVREGGVVALCLPDCIDAIVGHLAVAKVGAITVLVDPEDSGINAKVLEHLSPDLVLLHEGVSGAAALDFSDAVRETIRLAGSAEELLASERVIGETPPELTHNPARAVVLCPTAAGMTALFCNGQLEAATKSTGSGGGRRTAAAEPVSGVGTIESFVTIARLLATGQTGYVCSTSPAETLDVVERYRLGTLRLTASGAEACLELGAGQDLDLSSVRTLVGVGTQPSPGVVAEVRHLFGAPWVSTWGLAEAGGTVLCTAVDAGDDVVFETVGQPCAGIEVQLRGGSGQRIEGPGTGKLWVRSDVMMSRYWASPAATQEVLVDGWLATNTLMSRDASSNYRLVEG